MLKLVLGPAGTGKTARVIEEIRERVEAGQGKNILIVPEQYSYEAERELLERCGDSTSLYAEVLSFSRLASTVEQELGGGARVSLDKGGRLLRLRVAMENVGVLEIFKDMVHRPENLPALLHVLDELHAAGATENDLRAAAARLQEKPFSGKDTLRRKLQDLASIVSECDRLARNGTADSLDRLDRLAENVKNSGRCRGSFVWVDGFVDFTAQEQKILRELWRQGTVTVCLSCEEPRSIGKETVIREEYACSLTAAGRLREMAREDGAWMETPAEKEPAAGGPSVHPSLRFVQENLLQFTTETCDPADVITLSTAPTPELECELAAAEVLRRVEKPGCRWRDVAIAVRGFEDYRLPLETVFARYGIPLYSTRPTGFLSKSAAVLLLGALTLPDRGWAADDVLALVKTGLLDVTAEECDELENYVLMWNIHGGGWYGPDPWRQHPDGFDAHLSENPALRERQLAETAGRLKRLNGYRERVAGSLNMLHREADQAHTASEHCRALSRYCENIHLPQNLSRRAEELRLRGHEDKANELLMVWNKIVEIFEQFAAVLGNTPMNRQEFATLLRVMLSCYEINTIPYSLDSVSAGDFDRMRRRRIRHLLVLGADNERLPAATSEDSILTVTERRFLCECLESGNEWNRSINNDNKEMQREYALIYNVFSLPSESLYVSRPLQGMSGDDTQASFVLKRLLQLTNFRGEKGYEEKPGDVLRARASCRAGILELAASGWKEAEDRLEEKEKEKLEMLRAAADNSRDRALSRDTARKLYGDIPRMSPTSLDAYGDCPYKYFLRYGLNARIRKPAEFDSRIYGSYVHALLEAVVGAAREKTDLEHDGISTLKEEDVQRLCDEATEKFIHEELNDFKEKTSRFKYVFLRVQEEARSAVRDTVEELQRSAFRPLCLEHRVTLPGTGGENGRPALTGQADRVDTWEKDGIVYLRVVDYKSGKKEFDYADLRDGLSLQMLLYLFALKNDPMLQGKNVQPAGVLYVPAKDSLISLDAGQVTEENVEKERRKRHRRSGLLLHDEAVLAAMEQRTSREDDFLYLPLKVKNGIVQEDNLAAAARLQLLESFTETMLAKVAEGLRQGNIAASPWRRGSSTLACEYCDYHDVCRFDETREECRVRKSMKAADFWSLREAENGSHEEMNG